MDASTEGGDRTRQPTAEDVLRIVEALNNVGARYALIGGFAMQLHGFERPTQDIDFLVDPSAPNIELLKQALCVLEDKAVLDVQPDDVATYGVVRVADEVVVDLLSEACGVTFDDIEPECEELEVQGVRIRVPIPEALLRTKQTVRPKDAPDRAYLEALIAGLRRTR